jgi:hypothetical protein
MKRLLILAAVLGLASGCTINRAHHFDIATGKMDADIYRSTLFVNATATLTWDGQKFDFEYNQQSDAVVKALEKLAPLLQQAALAGAKP